ncbi:MAG: hypothetical protein BWY57_01977 [Betaproteobacteria bacterium ADurb.Bin341]|nr:MAG: hypothetical protein BWY57_01977 [Betaproteobacteria bacterium ADurb.Bin341]
MVAFRGVRSTSDAPKEKSSIASAHAALPTCNRVCLDCPIRLVTVMAPGATRTTGVVNTSSASGRT